MNQAGFLGEMNTKIQEKIQSLYEVTYKLELSDARGIYIPRDAAETMELEISKQDKIDLSNPENEHYWDTWQSVLDKEHTHKGEKYGLYQNGDLFSFKVKDWTEGLAAIESSFEDCDMDYELDQFFSF